MASTGINKHNVGRIAERIVSNELEYRGFRVSDLNKEGISANADLLAACEGHTWQIQVKGSTYENGWWFGYGHCTEPVLAGTETMFNRSIHNFYKAQVVVLVCVKSPHEYQCLVLPEHVAEEAAQMNLDWATRPPKIKGGAHKAGGKVYVDFYDVPKNNDETKKAKRIAEKELVKPYLDNWDWLQRRGNEAEAVQAAC
jgi:hypothetical protein